MAPGPATPVLGPLGGERTGPCLLPRCPGAADPTALERPPGGLISSPWFGDAHPEGRTHRSAYGRVGGRPLPARKLAHRSKAQACARRARDGSLDSQ